eukprot:gnl/TRDRNA2_/TRDRNA2_44036_c0_seq1.p1 gnl/TRDRNA2_/TRDRNA2_44036_c0~~gnl/TRDRNA2_/TRDRNA2_44036_c0_seq1.p1  ORF type:complete len:279 (+),score=58.10 gnl/TRDRNA2_/TRDRNA2_44036_c0_seq1:14-850(+)
MQCGCAAIAYMLTCAASAILASKASAACDGESTAHCGIDDEFHGPANPAAKKHRIEAVRRAVADVAGAIGMRNAPPSPCPRSPRRGSCSSFKVPYEVKATGQGTEMGVFLTSAVKKGQLLWAYNDTDHLEIFEQDIPALRRALGEMPKGVTSSFLDWVYTWPAKTTGVLFEYDDGRYVNNAEQSKVNEVEDSSGHYTFAAMDLPAGTELLESYKADGAKQFPKWWLDFYDEVWSDEDEEEEEMDDDNEDEEDEEDYEGDEVEKYDDELEEDDDTDDQD